MPSKKSSQLPSREQMVQAVAAEQKFVKAQSYAQALREKAAKVTNKQEREKMIREAYEKEVEARGHSKFAQRLQSGTWQGGAAGGGIGLGSGVGLGTVVGTTVGTVVGGLVSIPTTGLGILIGMGIGAAHGPWIKLGGKEKKFEDASPEEVVDEIEQRHAEQREAIEVQTGMAAEGGGDQPLPGAEPVGPTPKRKPRKIEIRSQSIVTEGGSQSTMEIEAPMSTGDLKKRPRKLQERSRSNGNSLPIEPRENKRRDGSTAASENQPPETS